MNLSDIAANMLQQRSTADLIADALREAILRSIFRPGQSLRQDEIATQFGVSRIPVREALRQLETEGLVTLHLNRSATVTELSVLEVQEICEIRSALEVTALELALKKLTAADLEKAAMILDQASSAIAFVKLNWEFHATLYAAAERPRLLKMIKTLHVNLERYVNLQMDDWERYSCRVAARSQKEHYQLLDACRAKDTKAAVKLLKRHIEATKQLMSELNHL